MKQFIFGKVENMGDVREVVHLHADKLVSFHPELLEQHYQSLACMNPSKEEKFLPFVHYVDQQFSSYGFYGFTFQKLITVLTAATYYHMFYDRISNLSNGELSILAKYSFLDPVEEYSKNIECFPKSVLSLVEGKTADFTKRDELMKWYDYSLGKGENSEELLQQLQSSSLSDLIQKSFQLEDKVLEEVEFCDGRGI